MIGGNSSDLPPGFRFHPTDEELIMYYLRNQAKSRPCPVAIIPEVDIYKFDPWELPEKAEFGEKEWYFFSPRDRKYPNGVRPNRAAVSGYWKATGTDKAIYSGTKFVGVKKALVFYKGKPPKGVKSDWIMHEYRLSTDSSITSNPNKQNGSMRLDDWVLCRIYKKKNPAKTPEHMSRSLNDHDRDSFLPAAADPQAYKFPRTCSLTHLWEFDYISQLLHDDINYASCNLSFTTQSGTVTNHNDDDTRAGAVPAEKLYHHHQAPAGHVQLPYVDGVKFEVNQPIFVNHSLYQHQ